MGRGRKRLPTELKKIKGTLEHSRVLDNEMKVSVCSDIPEAPDWLSETGKKHWYVVTNELYTRGMLHGVDISLITAYCNEMALYQETEELLREKSRVYVKKNEEGEITYAAAVPHQKIAKDALDRALKLAVQFGFTPSARSSIPAPQTPNTDVIDITDIIDKT